MIRMFTKDAKQMAKGMLKNCSIEKCIVKQEAVSFFLSVK